ncbi:calcium-binding and coiled-coil domain-containing protein 2 isoform X2 [Anabas testudineus]|uniref:calcium-binding and coiled-coil domain-containing protein 2 isoform X2 n=1 Tax=Anabas testudineus TaxID=64144 RepID=UPI000E459A1E|nr:calcium-binding and coiled-coil domain-containing protein 2 isoform X2 [Anabas testudineus]
MERPTEAAAHDSSTRTFSQVVFTNIPHSYPPSTVVTCHYTLTAGYKPHPRDWVGIFKVGWSTTKDYHTFVWAEHNKDGQQPMTKVAVFKEYYLPKDEVEFYQFCYIDNSGQVRGASTPFSFKTPVEPNMESLPVDDVLYITTQEQVEQSARERAELQEVLDQIREENETLRRELQRQQQEATSLKEQKEQRDQEKVQLVKELDQIKEQNRNLTSRLQLQEQEIEHLKEELVVQQTKQLGIEQQIITEQKKLNEILSVEGASSKNEEKYDRALSKIKQLKQEQGELKGKVDAQSEEISQLNIKLRETERDLSITRDSIHLTQVDLQSSEKDKERLSAELQRLQTLTHNMNEVKRENQELCRRLSQQEMVQSSPDNDLQGRYQTVVSQLQDTQAKLVAEKEEGRNIKTRADFLDRELQAVKEQLDNIALALDQEKRNSSKTELLLLEAREAIQDKESIIEDKEHMIRLVTHEKEELTRENQALTNDIEGLRTLYSNFHDDSQNRQPDAASAAGTTSTSHAPEGQDTPEQTENLYETIDSLTVGEEEILVCRHCHESFPGITQQELELHELSHRVCPFCTMICDNMEQSVFEDHVYSHEL